MNYFITFDFLKKNHPYKSSIITNKINTMALESSFFMNYGCIIY